MISVSSICRRIHATNFWTIVSLFDVGLFLLLLVYPLLRLTIPSLTGSVEGQSFISIYASLPTSAYYRVSLVNSIILSLSATVLALIVGTSLAYLVSRYDLRGKLIIRAAIVLIFVSPPFIGAYSCHDFAGFPVCILNGQCGIEID